MTASAAGLPSGNAARTVEFWYTTIGGSPQTVLGYGSDFSVAVGGSQVQVSAGGGSVTLGANYDYAANLNGGPTRWHLFDITLGSVGGVSTASFYLDGQLQSSAPLSASTVLSSGLTLGSGAGTEEGWAYDELAIYPSTLSPQAIDKHWTSAASPSATPCASAPTSSYATSVLANHPVAYYRLNDFANSLVAYDSSGNCSNGAYVSPTYWEQSVPGALASDPSEQGVQSYNNGVNQVMTASAAGLPSGNAARTVEFWCQCGGIYAPTVFSYGSDFSIGISGPAGTTAPAEVAVAAGGKEAVFYPPGFSGWHLFDVTLGPVGGRSTVALYIDGQLEGSQPLSAKTVLSSGLTLGSGGGNEEFNEYDELAIYPTVLTPGQIADHAGVADFTGPVGGPVAPAESRGGGGFCLPCLLKAIVHTIFGAPVDAEDGNMYHTFNDIQIPGRGFSLAFTRTYNSNAASANGLLGYGWVDNLGANLAVSGSTAVLTEENGAQTTFTLNGSSWQAPPRDIATLTQNPDGTWTLVRQAQQTLTFNSSGQLTSMSDLNGNTLTYSYTGGQLASVTDGAGRSLSLSYSGGHIVSVSDANGTPNRVVTFKYDSAGNLTDVIDVAGGDTHFTYDSAHRMISMKDPTCFATAGCPGIVNTYDGQGRVVVQADQLGRKTKFAYAGDPSSGAGGTTTITDPKGNVTVDVYQYGVKVSETRGSGTTQAASTTYGHDPSTLQPTAITDPNGNMMSMTYDANGNMLSRTDPLGRKTTWTYNALNEPLTITDPKGVTATNTYDSRGNLLSASTPCPDCSPSGTRTTTYNHADSSHPGDLTSMVDPAGKTWTYTYDSYGDRLSSTDPLGDKTTWTYNPDGWMTSRVSPRGNVTGGNPAAFTTTYAHNPFGQVTATTDPLGHTTMNGYDADQNLTSVKDPDGNTTSYVYDLANEQTGVHRADGTTTSTTYWPDGTIKAQIDGAGHPTSYAYDHLGRATSVTDPLGRVTHYGYDRAGNRTSITDAQGQVTRMTYDGANELTSISYSDGKTPDVKNITYDADGQRTGMSDGTGAWSWKWDALHQLLSVTEGTNGTVSYDYDLRNLPTKITYPGGLVVTRGYDAAGRWTSVKDWLGNATKFSYDPDGNLTRYTLPTATGVVDASTYDRADRLSTISDKNATAPVFAAIYKRDANGQGVSDGPQLSSAGSYRYTALNQICYAGSANTTGCSSPPAGSTPYQYDNADNLVQTGQTTQSFDAANQLCWTISHPATGNCSSPPSGATTYIYDARGNRTGMKPATGTPVSLAYDQANRLIQYTDGTTAAAYTYNGDGLRMSKTIGSTSTAFVWDTAGGLPLLLKDGSSAYVYGPGGLPLEQINGSTVLWLHHDQLGSTRLITDNTGAPVASFTYDPYGNLTASSGTASTLFRYAGQYRDTESGLYYLRARYYDPVTSQFLTVDPAVDSTLAPYTYVGGNPLNASDPSGLLHDCGLATGRNCDPSATAGWWGTFLQGAGGALRNGTQGAEDLAKLGDDLVGASTIAGGVLSGYSWWGRHPNLSPIPRILGSVLSGAGSIGGSIAGGCAGMAAGAGPEDPISWGLGAGGSVAGATIGANLPDYVAWFVDFSPHLQSGSFVPVHGRMEFLASQAFDSGL